jgi:hypothetical protein
MGSQGARYLVSAREARTPIDRSDRVEMADATIELDLMGWDEEDIFAHS